jgi:hypothetical protein
MKSFREILDSFEVQDTLNPKVWENPTNPSQAKLKSKIRIKLLDIANEFLEQLGEDIFVDDVVLTGSLANFNWSQFSDFDLHLIIDFEQFGGEKEVHVENFKLKKQIFNEQHNIKIYGYDVELYAQDLEESHFATGVYSVLNDEWNSEPEKLEFNLDKNMLEKKVNNWIEKIDATIEKSETENGELLSNLKEKIADYRKSGLEKNGELSYENLVFKFLRRNGYIEKLFDALNKSLDKKLSLERKIEESA